MKRYLTLIILVFTALSAAAVPPRLKSETLFTNKIDELRRPGIDLAITKNTDNYYRGIIVKNNRPLLDHVKGLVEVDRKRASNTAERYVEDGGHIILNIPSNGHLINIGLYWKDSGDFRFFIQSELAAFE